MAARISQPDTARPVANRARQRRAWSMVLCALGLAGCAWDAPAPAVPPAASAGPVPVPPPATTAANVALTAHSMVGVPYRWGGASPEGFDCSGLVHYAYAAHGVTVPRTTRRLYAAVQPVARDELRAGDLLFFRTSAKGGHVGIALDHQRFVHAPSSGKRVAVASLSQPWYRDRLMRVGRLAAASGAPAGRLGAAGP